MTSEPMTDVTPTLLTNVNEDQDETKAGDIDSESFPCGICSKEADEGVIECDGCKNWFHAECVHLTEEQYTALGEDLTSKWYCSKCITPLLSNVKWGDMRGEIAIRSKLDEIFQEISGWKNNIFDLPRGNAGKEFIEELTRLLNLFNHKTQWKNLAVSLVHVFMPIMLQKPAAKSKPKQNAQYLQKRLGLWENGDLDSLMREAHEIQKRLQIKHQKSHQDRRKAFCRLMMTGKVNKALKFIDETSNAGVLPLTDEVISALEDKHPDPGPVSETALLDDSSSTTPEAVIFEAVDIEAIQKAAKDINGSGGPSNVDADIWRHLICSKFHEKQSNNLAQAIADFTKILCAEEVDPQILKEFIAGRLIPLDKNPGVRPIGIGEVLRRIVAKSVIRLLNKDIQNAAGPLQTCTGVQSGIEAAIHAMREIFEESDCQAVLLIDANNAFNTLNREVALHNIKVLCPPFYRFLHNVYQCPAKLYIRDPQNSDVRSIYSKEGATQGDPAAMPKYALGTKPLMDKISECIQVSDNTYIARQVWYADDLTGAGTIEGLKDMWDKVCECGPEYGYTPNAKKTILIVKGAEYLPTAKCLFGNAGVQITTQGEKHLGAVIGSEDFRQEYMEKKVRGWVEELLALSEIAKEEPQLAYAAYTKGLSHKWTYVQRTVKDVSEYFSPLEQVIRNSLIPSLLGRHVSDLERRLLALPLRYGGLGIANPVLTSDKEYEASISITEGLKNLICEQQMTLNNLDTKAIESNKTLLRLSKEARFRAEYKDILSSLPKTNRRALEQSLVKGASSWLSALPLRSLGYCLNKREFRDSLHLRYGWTIPDIHSYCACGSKNDVDHVLICKKGGYVSFRHNALRDVEAQLLREVCRDVKVEPALLPTNKEDHPRGTNTADQARLDIAATGLWGTFERTFWDVRVTHANAPSNSNMTLEKLFDKNEKEKKSKYSSRVINTEKSSFVPLVYSTAGAVAPECDKHHKRVAELIASKRRESYAHVLNFIRTKIRFALLKSVLIAVRGIRGKGKEITTQISDVAFGLIPTKSSYESLG